MVKMPEVVEIQHLMVTVEVAVEITDLVLKEW